MSGERLTTRLDCSISENDRSASRGGLQKGLNSEGKILNTGGTQDRSRDSMLIVKRSLLAAVQPQQPDKRIRAGVDFPLGVPQSNESWQVRKARARWVTGDDGATHKEKLLLAAIRAIGFDDVGPGIVNGCAVPHLLQLVADVFVIPFERA